MIDPTRFLVVVWASVPSFRATTSQLVLDAIPLHLPPISCLLEDLNAWTIDQVILVLPVPDVKYTWDAPAVAGQRRTNKY